MVSIKTQQVEQKNTRWLMVLSLILRILNQTLLPIKVALFFSTLATTLFLIGIITGSLTDRTVKTGEIFVVGDGTPPHVCKDTCYANPDNCSKNCGIPCKKLTLSEITNVCGWGKAQPTWVAYQCCGGETTTATTTSTPTPVISPTTTALPSVVFLATPTTNPTQSSSIYDLDKNGIINLLDYNEFKRLYDLGDLKVDFNRDKKVDLYDFSDFKDHYPAIK